MYIKEYYLKDYMTTEKFITGKPGWNGAAIENRRANWRYQENGIYNNKPLDKDYFRKYMAVKVQCPNCSKMVSHGDLSKHKKRNVCIKNAKVDS